MVDCAGMILVSSPMASLSLVSPQPRSFTQLDMFDKTGERFPTWRISRNAFVSAKVTGVIIASFLAAWQF